MEVNNEEEKVKKKKNYTKDRELNNIKLKIKWKNIKFVGRKII